MRRLHAATTASLVAGLSLTALLGWSTWAIGDENEDRLLAQRALEAGAVLQAAVPGVQTPLAAGAELVEAAGGQDWASFQRVMSPLVGEDAQFASASVWRLDRPEDGPVLVLGAPPALAAQPPERVREFLERSASNALLSVIGLLDGPERRIGYSFTPVIGPSGPSPRFMAYAESSLPPDRTAAVAPDGPFSGLHHAIYLGGVEDDAALLRSSTSDLPLRGRRAHATVPFGDTGLLLVMSPTDHQGGRLLALLPWLVVGLGLPLTAFVGMLVERQLRRRDEAERLAELNEALFAEQHRVAHTLQRSLLPARLPERPGLELAVRYLPGVRGMEIGGDWYDAVPLDGGRLALLVGDVSGRGLPAAGAVASLRFSGRAFASQGDDPATILTKLNDLTEPDADGHFATSVCVSVDLGRGHASAASAGHPPPLLLGPGGARYLETVPGQPIGVPITAPYQLFSTALPPAGTLLLFTDGLFERRGEPLDVGLERLRRCAGEATGPLADTLDAILDELVGGDVVDDVALLGLRWPT